MRDGLFALSREIRRRQVMVWLASLAALATVALGMVYLLGQRAPDPLILPNAALEGMGAHLAKVTITAWQPLQPGQEPEATAAQVAAALGAAPAADADRVLAPGSGNERQAYTLQGQAGGTLTLTVHAAEPATLSAILELPPGAPWWTWRSRLTTAMGRAAPPRAYTVLEYDAAGGRLWADRDRVARSVLKRLGAQTVEGVSDGQLYSLSAYSPRLPARLVVAGRAVNAAVALHWDQVNGQTRLWLGSPVINIEY